MTTTYTRRAVRRLFAEPQPAQTLDTGYNVVRGWDGSTRMFTDAELLDGPMHPDTRRVMEGLLDQAYRAGGAWVEYPNG